MYLVPTIEHVVPHQNQIVILSVSVQAGIQSSFRRDRRVDPSETRAFHLLPSVLLSSSQQQEGETVLVHSRSWLSGERLQTVPPGHVWLEGDNASNSTDSRYYGPVPLAMVRGRVFLKVRLRGRGGRTGVIKHAFSVVAAVNMSSINCQGSIRQQKWPVQDFKSMQIRPCPSVGCSFDGLRLACV